MAVNTSYQVLESCIRAWLRRGSVGMYENAVKLNSNPATAKVPGMCRAVMSPMSSEREEGCETPVVLMTS
jgi:hypothetical protein